MKDTIERAELPGCAIQIDLDAVYSYESNLSGIAPTPGAEDAVYTIGVPRMLDFLDRGGIRASFFVVGQDLEVRAHREALRHAVDRGHEIANHSYTHPLALANLGRDSILNEIRRTHDLVRSELGVECRGFRTPGWNIAPSIFDALLELDYVYDASVCPSWTLPIQTVILKVLSGFRAPFLFGDWRVSMAPSQPYFPNPSKPWKPGEQRRLLEIPAGVSPGTRIPFCATTQLTVGQIGFARSVRRVKNGVIAYSMHGIDFLDKDELPQTMSRHPTAQIGIVEKMAFLGRVLELVATGRESITTLEHALAFRPS